MNDDLLSDDPVIRSDQLDREILAIPSDRVFTKRTIGIAFGVVIAILMVLVVLLLRYASSTNDAVRREIPRLEEGIVERDDTITQQQGVLTQAVDAILAMQQQIRDLGGTPPEVVLRPEE